MSVLELRTFNRLKQRRWRENNPVRAAWNDHKHNCKLRGILCNWSFEDFGAWCRETGYHILRRDGYQIHRTGDVGPYELGRVRMVKAEINRYYQDFYRRKPISQAKSIVGPKRTGFNKGK